MCGRILQETYAQLDTLGKVYAKIHLLRLQKAQTSEGSLYLKPGKMRWDYQRPSPKVFVSNSVSLWVYEPDKAQAHRRKLSAELPVAEISDGSGTFWLHLAQN